MSSTIHLEALTEAGATLFPKLASFKQDFYLVGGTALALQIGHRLSVDFDMFSNEELPQTLLPKIKRTFPDTMIVPTINNPEQMNITVKGVKMTFFWYQYPPVVPLIDHENVRMCSVQEIAAMKAFAIGKRGTYRDYVDMYFLLHEGHVTIEQLFEITRKKYAGEFHERLFLEQLLYMEDIPDIPVDFLRDSVSRQDIQTVLDEHVRSFRL